MARKTSKAAAKPSVRMYRHGLGDCFLVTLPRSVARPLYILIDCGVIIGTADASAAMRAVVDDVVETTGGRIDILIVTHEHWDHVSGFVQARDSFEKLKVGEVWLAWTEKRGDELADGLRAKHMKLRMALTDASARMRLAGAGDGLLDGLLGFFGAAGSGTTAQAMEIAASLGEKPPRYCYPTDAPVALKGTGARIYVLGPPYDLKRIKRSNPSSAHPETYSAADIEPSLDLDGGAPFDPVQRVPLEYARQMPFFRDRYWGEDPESEEKDQAWRAIDGSWLEAASSLALALDSATNNTSLVVAIELEGGEVLLFAADAQVGNWLSWQDCRWEVGGKQVSGPDLLGRTVLYKVGHHGSHNATLQASGLEQMQRLRIALLPVDQTMAKKKGWLEMPLESLEHRLMEKTGGAVLRIDRDIPAVLAGKVRQDPKKKLYYEVSV